MEETKNRLIFEEDKVMTNYEIVKKLIGPVEPLGCGSRDPERLENLIELSKLAGNLIIEIENLAVNHSLSSEHSVQKAGKYADDTLKGILDDIDYRL